MLKKYNGGKSNCSSYQSIQIRIAELLTDLERAGQPYIFRFRTIYLHLSCGGVKPLVGYSQITPQFISTGLYLYPPPTRLTFKSSFLVTKALLKHMVVSKITSIHTVLGWIGINNCEKLVYGCIQSHVVNKG